MKILITGYNQDKTITAIKGIRAVAADRDLTRARDLIRGPMPVELECRSDLKPEAILNALAEHGVRADEGSISPDSLSELKPEEIVCLVHLFGSTHEGAMFIVDGKAHLLDDVPGMESLAKKVRLAGERQDVKDYIDAHYNEAL